MRHVMTWLVALALLALAPAPTLAAGLSEAEVDRVAASATRLQDQGRWTDALAALEHGIAACAPGDAGRRCRVGLRVTAGYLAHRQSRSEKDGEAVGRQAVAYYEEVLREDPTHGATLNNLALVYQTLGETARAIALLQRGLRGQATMSAALAVTLGDLLRDEKRLPEALDAYRQALGDDPDDAVAASRIVGVYRDLVPARIAELAKLLTDWSRRPALDEVVEQGHRSVIEGGYATQEPLALATLVVWVELSARRRWISSRGLALLPAGWKPPAVIDLASYLAAPERPPSSNSWWRREARTRNALAGVALALGHERLAQGDAAGAQARWDAGVAMAPRYDEYEFRTELKGAWIVRADLQSQLASLYVKVPALDPQRARFAVLVRDLFSGKGQAYQSGDPEAIQRYHTVLGLIYAERKEWTSPTYFTNAIFQLDNAIKRADAREKERGPQPLPELKALLAQGYVATGKTREARSTYVRAVEAYLDTDDLGKAREMLDLAKGVAGTPLPAEPALETILRLRAAIPTAPAADVASEDGFRRRAEHAWIFGGALPGVNAEFLARQRFKALADLSTRARESGQISSATRYAAAAMNRGVKDVRALIDFGDLVRVRSIRKAVTEPVIVEPAGGKVSGKTWLLSVPGEASARQVPVSPEVVLAARAVEALEADSRLLAREVSVTIKGASVQISGRDETYVRDAATKLGRIEGVQGVQIRQ